MNFNSLISLLHQFLVIKWFLINVGSSWLVSHFCQLENNILGPHYWIRAQICNDGSDYKLLRVTKSQSLKNIKMAPCKSQSFDHLHQETLWDVCCTHDLLDPTLNLIHQNLDPGMGVFIKYLSWFLFLLKTENISKKMTSFPNLKPKCCKTWE